MVRILRHAGGKALVEILDGRVTPSGKLPDTWSRDYWDIPAAANFYQPDSPAQALGADVSVFVDTCYQEDIYVGYRYFETFDVPVAYPFGYGLSYTSFDIKGELQGQNVRVQIKNTGDAAGKEVVQVYAEIPDGKLEQPAKRLVAFGKTRLLQPGEDEELDFSVTDKELESFDCNTADWVMEAGRYKIFVGNSVKALNVCGEFAVDERRILRHSEHLMKTPVEMPLLTKKDGELPKGIRTGVKEGVRCLEPGGERRHYSEEQPEVVEQDFVDTLSLWELARLSVCASHGWGMHEKGEAGRIFALQEKNIPSFRVADGNSGVNVRNPNIGMPSSNLMCATWNSRLMYDVAGVLAEEAKENDIQMILAPAMNIHRNPLCGRHPEYFSEDPYLAGIMAGNLSKGLEDRGVSSSVKHVIANNSEATRKRNHSLIPERALREIYLKAFEVALGVHQPDSIMTAYNACNGCFTAEDEELIQGVFRREFGFQGFVMTDWNSYDTADVAGCVQAGNCWLTPGTVDDTFVTLIVEGVKEGRIDEKRLRANVRYLLRVVQKRTGVDLGVL